MQTTVVNKAYARGTVYIGRRVVSMHHYGNLFSHKLGSLGTVFVATRAEAVARYRSWLLGDTDVDVEPERRRWILANLHTLRGQTLECFCKPAACRGDVLAEMADRQE